MQVVNKKLLEYVLIKFKKKKHYNFIQNVTFKSMYSLLFLCKFTSNFWVKTFFYVVSETNVLQWFYHSKQCSYA